MPNAMRWVLALLVLALFLAALDWTSRWALRALEFRRERRAIRRALDMPTTHDAHDVYWADRKPKPPGAA